MILMSLGSPPLSNHPPSLRQPCVPCLQSQMLIQGWCGHKKAGTSCLWVDQASREECAGLVRVSAPLPRRALL